MFLALEEVRRLTGKKKKDAQKRVLKAKGYRFGEDDVGRPLVLMADVERKIKGKATSPEPKQGADFSAFPRLGVS
jgi:hypothetical protein